MRIELQNHYDIYVQTNVAMDILRQDECLCLNCQRKIFDLNSKEFHECPVAPELYKLCKKENIALMITRCPNFTNQKEEADMGLR